jgi:asparagine synthase (glutamine-hydrolysing)
LYHYIGFIWDPAEASASQMAALLSARLGHHPEWVQRLNLPGLVVFDKPPRREWFESRVLPDETGIILGKVFPAQVDVWTPTWRADFSKAEGRSFTLTGGRQLVEDYWGGYIAFLYCSVERKRYVIRDCSGKIPCFRTQANGVGIVFANVEDLDGLHLPAFTINWRYLAAFIRSSQLQIRETAINEVTELLAGDCLVTARDGQCQIVLWDPRRICNDNIIEDAVEAMRQLKSTAQQCINAWASTYRHVLLSLSGGFDSAVVLGCLCQAPTKPLITCLNRFEDDVAGDERKFARLAATRAGVKLIERSFSAHDDLLGTRLFGIPKTVKPSVSEIIGMSITDIHNDIARSVSADVSWTGQGGDHLFFQMPSPLGAADYIQLHGMGLRLVPVIRDAARVSQMSYWEVLCNGLTLGRSRLTSKPDRESNQDHGFLTADFSSESAIESMVHPWTEHAEYVPKGKQYQIRCLSEVVNRDRPIPSTQLVEAHHPLLSQPLMELCLRIPVYGLLKDGRRRGLARAAFQSALPSEIIERESKGTTTAYVLGLLRDSQPFIADLLLDGMLVREGLLDKKAMAPYVLRAQPMRSEHLFPLLASISAEIWLRSWAKSAQRAVA